MTCFKDILENSPVNAKRPKPTKCSVCSTAFFNGRPQCSHVSKRGKARHVKAHPNAQEQKYSVNPKWRVQRRGRHGEMT